MDNTHLVTVTGTVTVNDVSGLFWYSIDDDMFRFRIEGGYSLRDGDIIQVTGKVIAVIGNAIVVRGEYLKMLHIADENRTPEN